MTDQGLLVFDVDSTFIEEEVIELLADATGRRDEVAAVTERAMRGELDFSQSLRERVAVLEGLPVSVFADAAAAVAADARCSQGRRGCGIRLGGGTSSAGGSAP